MFKINFVALFRAIRLSAVAFFVAGSVAAMGEPNTIEPLRIGTSADVYPYSFGPADGCKDVSGVCGFEIDLFNAICAEMKMTCQWVVNPWDSIFTNLTTKNSQGEFAYDAIVDSVEASPSRRLEMLFSAAYFSAAELFVGKTSLNVTFAANGFPQDGQPLRIGTWSGYLVDELNAAYGGAPNTIKVIAVTDPIQSLQNGEIDLALVYTGIEKKLLENPAYAVKGKALPSIDPDPFGSNRAATRISKSGRKIEELFSQGLVQIRTNGTYFKISNKWMGRDIWDCQLGPWVPGSCGH